MKKVKTAVSLSSLLIILLISIVVIVGIMYFAGITPNDVENFLSEALGLDSQPSGLEPGISQGSTLPRDGLLSVTVIDCGNADSIFIRSKNGKTMLIDAGESDDFEKIDSFLKNSNVDRIDVLVATHPHNDHIGSMSKIVDAYEIGAVYMPKVAHNTKTYEKLATTIVNKGMNAIPAKGGSDSFIPFDEDLKLTILAPLSDEYSDLNDFSVVIRLEYGDVVFLFPGDIESASEKELLDKYPQLLDCDVLKVAHHGSDTSTSKKFIKAASPSLAVITCEYASDYGHPSQEVTDRLTENGVRYYRSDENGNVAFYTDGQDISVVTEK